MDRNGVVKVCYGPRTVAIKPANHILENFLEEIRIRMPQLRTKTFEITYKDFDGDKVTICNSADFETFLGYKISKVYVNCKRGPRSKQTNEEGMAGTSTHRGNVDKDLPSSNCTLASTSANKVNYDSDNGEDNNEDKTLENVQMDPNASVIESVAIMIDMGFENDDNWLDDVLQLAQGDISEVIEFLSPIAVD